ncbi:MAG TPA: hypothetical protein VGD74_05560 [Vulgatibacter sp.]
MASRVALRALMLLALLLPLPALALGPAVLDGPDLRQLSAGPMVYGGGDGVTCTPVPGVGLRCSDGRVSTTVRASAVPCGDGYAASNVACVDGGGLQAWGANQTLIADGGNLTAAAWTINSGVTVSRDANGIHTVSYADGITSSVGVRQTPPTLTKDETRTVACVMQAGTSDIARIYASTSGFYTVPQPPEWAVISRTQALTTGTVPTTQVGFGAAAETAARNGKVKGCWHVTGSTPGRPCWFENGTAGTCAADVHTISTSGWPTTEGEICVSADIGPSGSSRVLLEGATNGTDGGTLLNVDSSNRFVVATRGGESITGSAVAAGPHRYCARRRNGTTSITVDGVVVGSSVTFPALKWRSDSRIGSAYSGGVALEGTISRLSWSAR